MFGYNPDDDKVHLEGRFEFLSLQEIKKVPVDPRFCNLDVLELYVYSWNYNEPLVLIDLP